MEFRTMITITLYMRQQKRHWCKERPFGLCGRGRGWDDLGEWHWNMYNIIYQTSHQSRFDARYWMLGAGALGWPRGMVWGGRRVEGSGWETHVYLWWIHFDTWQNQYNIVKLKNKIKKEPQGLESKKKPHILWINFILYFYEVEKNLKNHILYRQLYFKEKRFKSHIYCFHLFVQFSVKSEFKHVISCYIYWWDIS